MKAAAIKGMVKIGFNSGLFSDTIYIKYCFISYYYIEGTNRIFLLIESINQHNSNIKFLF